MKYIVNFNPIIIEEIDYVTLADIEEKIKNKISISKEEASYFLDNLCYVARHKVNNNMDNFDYKCDIFQVMFYHYFNNLNCQFIPCMTQNVITDNIVGHSFSILKLIVDDEEKLILLDPSYIQFFNVNKCNDSNYFVDPNNKNHILLTPDPGYFIKENDKQIINILLSCGYIELDKNVARIYGDSFLNTKCGLIFDNNYQTISGSIYINSFLKGMEPIQKNEETLENLGLRIPLFQEKIEEKLK